ELQRPPHLASAFDFNDQGILGRSFRLQLAVGVDVLEVQADVVGADIEKFDHLQLRQPRRTIRRAQLDARAVVFAGVESQLVHATSSSTGKSCCIRPRLWVLSRSILLLWA